MKKFLTVLALVGILASCKDKKKEEAPEPKPVEPVVETPVITNSEVPKFADARVQAHAQAYQDMANDYKKAVDARDKDKLQKLGAVNSKLIKETGEMYKILDGKPEEDKKLTDFIIEKGKQIDAALKEWQDYEDKKMEEEMK